MSSICIVRSSYEIDGASDVSITDIEGMAIIFIGTGIGVVSSASRSSISVSSETMLGPNLR